MKKAPRVIYHVIGADGFMWNERTSLRKARRYKKEKDQESVYNRPHRIVKYVLEGEVK